PTAIKFLLTCLVLGIAATWLSMLLLEVFVDRSAGRLMMQSVGAKLIRILVLGSIAKLLFEAAVFRHLATLRNSPLRRSARLLVGPLLSQTFARFAAGVLGGVVMPLFLLGQ